MRQKYVLTLKVDVTIPDGTTRTEKVKAIRIAVGEVTERLLVRVEAIRAKDPEFTIAARDTIFPVFFIRTTPGMAAELERDPDVASITLDRGESVHHCEAR